MNQAAKRAIVMLGIGLVVIVCAAALIYLLRADAGFYQPASCGHAPLRWNKADIPVAVWLSEEDRDLEGDVKEAIKFWTPYFTWGGVVPPDWSTGNAGAKVVHVRSMQLQDIRPHGSTNWRHTEDEKCEIGRADIRIPMPLLHGKVRTCVVRHEFGHALGLGHDSSEDSVMHEFRDGKFGCVIMPDDAELLRGTYGKVQAED
jgi:hypothetical protein